MASREELMEQVRVKRLREQVAAKRAAAAEPVEEAVVETPSEPLGGLDTARGAIESINQGTTLGFGDEITGGIRAGIDRLLPNYEYDFGEGVQGEEQGLRDAYRMYRDDSGDVQEQFAEENPLTAAGLEIGGAIASPANILRGPAALAKAAPIRSALARAGAEGAAYGAGSAEEGEILEGAAKGAAGGVGTTAALRGAGKVLRKTLLEGLDVTPTARKLMDEGVYLTPGQAAKSKSASGLETVAGVVPFLARGTRTAREKAQKSYNANVLRKALPEGSSAAITDIGQEGAGQLKNAIDTGYKQAWEEVSVSPAALKNVYKGAAAAAEDLGQDAGAIMRRVMSDIEKGVGVDVLDDTLRRGINSSKSKYFVKEALENMRASLREGLPTENLAKLKVMDDAYPGYLTAMKATSKAAEDGGVFTPKQLIQSSRQVGGVTRTATGGSPLQEIASEGMETVGKAEGAQPLFNALRAIGVSFASPPGMQAAGRFAIGETSKQKTMAKLLRDYEDMIRGTQAGISRYAAGQAGE